MRAVLHLKSPVLKPHPLQGESNPIGTQEKIAYALMFFMLCKTKLFRHSTTATVLVCLN
jgi:hypothetical protein